MKRAILILSILAAAGAAGSYYLQSAGSRSVVFRTGEVKRGDLVVTINATGTVEPEEVIDVGAQVAGRILVFGTDAEGRPVDYGTPVEENMVLAR
jgi:HlyD family secretion protein